MGSFSISNWKSISLETRPRIAGTFANNEFDWSQEIALTGTQNVAQLLEGLRLEEVTDAVQNFAISIPDRRELEASSQKYAENRNKLLTLGAKQEATEESLQEIEASLLDNEPIP